MIALMEEMSATTHSMVGKTGDMAVDIAELRDHIANFDDFARPLRNYLYWEPHCYNIPVCGRCDRSSTRLTASTP